MIVVRNKVTELSSEMVCALVHAALTGLDNIEGEKEPHLVNAQERGTWRHSTDPHAVKQVEEKEARLRTELRQLVRNLL